MTATELLRYQLDDLAYQLRAVLENMTDEQLDTKLTEQSYTPRETVEHLCEAYMAYTARLNGETWNWGSFALEDKAKDAILTSLWQIRGDAVDAACDSDLEDAQRMAHAYLIAHDAYHVGQLSLVQLQTNPGWDPYSIYPPH
jgi:uncharacterized damage-inducible protein DinB